MAEVQQVEQSEEKVAMAIMAHPDDPEFGCAGTVARWVREGWKVYYVICTDGSGGGPDDAIDITAEARQRMSLIRQREERAAAEVLGVTDVVFLGYPDGILEPTLDLRRDIVRVLRRYRPTRVICQSPDRSWQDELRIAAYHPDHLAAGRATLAAIYPASQNPWDFPELFTQEGLQPHKVSEIYISPAPVHNYGVDITETFDVKCRALSAHKSQLDASESEIRRFLAVWNKEVGKKYGYTYAEEFHRTFNR